MTLDKYDSLTLIGSGGFATVWRAQHVLTRGIVALKIWHEPVDARRRVLFERECRALEALNHPNVVGVRDAEIGEDGLPFIVMEYIDGSSLDHLVPLSVPHALAAAVDAAEGLDALHGAGIFHRDIKPANLLRASDGTVKIGDLGIAFLSPARNDTVQPGPPTGLIGTTAFMAPEQLLGQTATEASDIYSLGATLFNLLVGEPPPISGLEGLRGVPTAVADLVKRCMAGNPEDRPPSARALADELTRLVSALDKLPVLRESLDRTKPPRDHVDAARRRSQARAETVVVRQTARLQSATAKAQLIADQPSASFDLSHLRNIKDVGRALGVDGTHLAIVLYGDGPPAYYREFTIKKKGGGVRTIASPRPVLRSLQDSTASLLRPLATPKGSAHGYVEGRSIVTNARNHLGQRHVLNIDLLQFFPSINFGRVRGVLMARPFNCGPDAATVLAQICCLKNELPIGAPTSPLLSNMVCMRLDGQLQRLAEHRGCWYTRYSDDITLSTDRERFPRSLAGISQGRTFVGPELRRVVTANGFAINDAKSRLQSSLGHQEVTGITVNETPNVNRTYVRNVRAMLHSLDRDGLVGAQFKMEQLYGERDRYPGARPSFQSVLRGRLAYLAMVRGRDDPLVLKMLSRYYELIARDSTR
jgi:RNA-directed DNA polymerase